MDHWSNYFDYHSMINLKDRQLNTSVYMKNYDPNAKRITVLIHGAGASALSWAVFAKYIETEAILAYDLRFHGDSVNDDLDMEISSLNMNTFVKDLIALLNEFENKEFILIGHSLGGAIAINAAEFLIDKLYMLIVVDVFESVALNSLNILEHSLLKRPKIFDSLESAKRHLIDSGQVKNSASLAISAQGYFKLQSNGQVTWKVDLYETRNQWTEWFKGITGKFLSLSPNISKILIINNLDKLDKDLTIAQMKGQFQIFVLPECSHALNEDAPEKLSKQIIETLQRYDRLMEKIKK